MVEFEKLYEHAEAKKGLDGQVLELGHQVQP
jgi:hypothetical protein